MKTRPARALRARALPLLAVVLAFGLLGAACGESKPPNVDAQVEEGLEAHAAGDIERAVKIYNAVLAKQPANKYALYNLGLIDQNAGRLKEAIARYRAALVADPDFEPALFNLAIALTPGDPQQAETLYRRIIELNPNHASAHLNLGFLLKSMGKEAEGQQEIDIAVTLDPALESNARPAGEDSGSNGAEKPASTTG